MALIAACSHDFIVTDHVAGEITDYYRGQQRRYAAARSASTIRQVSVTDSEAVALFVKLFASGRLGVGECSAISLAIHRDYILAIDDRRAERPSVSPRADYDTAGVPVLYSFSTVILAIFPAGSRDTKTRRDRSL